jgi:hypothetical protein
MSCDAGRNSGGELGISAGWPQLTYLSLDARFAKTMRFVKHCLEFRFVDFAFLITWHPARR